VTDFEIKHFEALRVRGNMNGWLRLFVVLSVLMLVVSCNKGESGDESGESTPAEGQGGQEGAPTQEAPALQFVAVESMGLRIEMPTGATVNPGAGDSVMISGPDGGCTVMLAPVTEISPSYESTVSSIQRGMAGGQLREMTRNEQTAGGWEIEYTTAAMSNPDETRYGVNTRVTVGGIGYDCSRVSRTAEDAACVLRACQSITQ